MNELTPTTWWVHGSAPGGEAFFEAALGAMRVALRHGQKTTTVTTNAGLVEFLCHFERDLYPDYYWLQDGAAIELFGRYAQTAVLRGGTKILTHRPAPIESRLGIVPEGVDLVNPYETPPRYIPGRYQHVTLSGLLCLQWVANHTSPGDTVILTGMTGYPQDADARATFDGRTGKAGGAAHNTERIAPFTRSVVQALAHPGAGTPGAGTPGAGVPGGVRFVFCGGPGPVFSDTKPAPGNVELCATPAGLKALFNPFQTPFEEGSMHHGEEEKGSDQASTRAEHQAVSDRVHAPHPRPAAPVAGPAGADHAGSHQTAGPETRRGLPGYQNRAIKPRDVTTR